MEDQSDSSSGVSPVYLPPGPVGGCPGQHGGPGYSSSGVSPVHISPGPVGGCPGQHGGPGRLL
jgi:hypothetical protein